LISIDAEHDGKRKNFGQGAIFFDSRNETAFSDYAEPAVFTYLIVKINHCTLKGGGI